MPSWVCEECGSEFWGWSPCYSAYAGAIKPCPSCGGALVCSRGAKEATCGGKSAA